MKFLFAILFAYIMSRFPKYGFYAVELLTHKLLRRTRVFPLGVTALTSALLWKQGRLYRAAALAQAVVYALGGAGIVLAGRPAARRRALVLPAFCFVNAASLRAVWNLVRGRSIDRREPRRAREPGQVGAEPAGSAATTTPGRPS